MGCSGSKQASQAPVTSQVASSAPEGDFKIIVQNPKGDAALGLGVKSLETKYILVESTKEEGLIPSWNRDNANTPEIQIKPGDMLIAINSKFGNCDEMLAECKSMSITLLVKRGSGSAQPPAEAPAAEMLAAEGPAAETPAETAAENPTSQPLAEAAVAEVSTADATAETPAAEYPAAEPAAAEDTTNLSALKSPTAEAPGEEQAPMDLAPEPAQTDATLGLSDASVSIEPETAEMDPAATGSKVCGLCW
jgi:hypothetical protein